MKMHRFSEFWKRYLVECKTSVIAFLLGFLLLVPMLAWQYQMYLVFALPFILVFALPNIVVFSAMLALGKSIALRIYTFGIAVALNCYIFWDTLVSRVDHFDAEGDVLVSNYNTFPVIFWQLFLSFAVFYAFLSYRRLAAARTFGWETLAGR
jgi:hypothetical protein